MMVNDVEWESNLGDRFYDGFKEFNTVDIHLFIIIKFIANQVSQIQSEVVKEITYWKKATNSCSIKNVIIFSKAEAAGNNIDNSTATTMILIAAAP